MLSKERIEKVERSYRHSDCLVFVVGERVFVAEECLKHPKDATIEMIECAEIDDSCFGFSPNDDDYNGEVSDAPLKNIILNDPFHHNANAVASVYYDDEVVEVFNLDTKQIESW